MNLMRLCVTPLVVMLGFSAALPVSAETLADIYALARQSDPKYLAMQSEYQATGFAVDEARAGLLPTVSYQYGRTKTKQDIVKSDNAVFATGSASYPTKEKTLSIGLPIFRLAVWRNWRQAKCLSVTAALASAPGSW